MSCGVQAITGAISAINEVANAGAKSAKEDAQLVIDTMEELLKAKMGEKYHELINERKAEEDKMIPIQTVMKHEKYIVCTYDQKSNVASLIPDAIKNFTDGSIAAGIGKLAKDLLTLVLSEADAKGKDAEKFVINIDEEGSISRLDTWFHARTVNASAMSKMSVKIVGCLVIKSSIDTSKLTDNQLRGLVVESFKGGDTPHKVLDILVKKFSALVFSKEGAEKYPPPSEEEVKVLDQWYEKLEKEVVAPPAS